MDGSMHTVSAPARTKIRIAGAAKRYNLKVALDPSISTGGNSLTCLLGLRAVASPPC